MGKSVVVYPYNKMLPAIRVSKQLLHPATWVNLTNIRFQKGSGHKREHTV